MESFSKDAYKTATGFYPKNAWKVYEKDYDRLHSPDPCTLHDICIQCMFKLKTSRCPYCYKSLLNKRNLAIHVVEARQIQINNDLREQYLNFRHPGHNAYITCDCYKECEGFCVGGMSGSHGTFTGDLDFHCNTDNESSDEEDEHEDEEEEEDDEED
jgi:hypothetical protein